MQPAVAVAQAAASAAVDADTCRSRAPDERIGLVGFIVGEERRLTDSCCLTFLEQACSAGRLYMEGLVVVGGKEGLVVEVGGNYSMDYDYDWVLNSTSTNS
uniref:Uncharacterized protein n=1 Tax=Oryza glumipatula TaxID=40148 RepID=A0A0E0BQZ3_9ORYZ